MVSTFYLSFIVASCLIVIHAHALIIVDERHLPITDLNILDGQERGLNNDQIFVSQRAIHYIIPPTASMSTSKQSTEYLGFLPIKRHSFGRKHHWDAFFGRRR